MCAAAAADLGYDCVCIIYVQLSRSYIPTLSEAVEITSGFYVFKKDP